MERHPLDSSRRDVMKALGAGAVLSGLGGTATAQTDDGQTDDGQGGDTPSPGDGAGTVYEVETLIRGPPTNPDRPVDFFYQPTGLHLRPGDVIKFVFTTPDHNVVSYHPAFGMRRRVPTGVHAFSSPILGWQPRSIADDQIEPPAEMDGGGEGGQGGAGQQSGDQQGGGQGDGQGGGGPQNGGQQGGSPRGPVPSTWLYAFETPGVYDLLCSPHETYGMAMRVVVGDATEAPFETSDPSALPAPRAGPVELARETLTDPALQPSNIVEQGAVAWESLEAVGGRSGQTQG
ncbi:twin-arginine translocation signal domain-containing protein [Halomicroarcula limicola]|uniref:Twin-arginine translocation signal domain-containing protein n=1 Tax=Haloarcula limicola TaxID=1429915 RepID=A0A8J7Y6I8_9EURY|nr:twin-arginine translocation signal domain-containing protein [Halomicroarcula limicola]MBV0922584.1 twin-arginine translocation signal domain-containing protein [Halomicroarcula limicola]